MTHEEAIDKVKKLLALSKSDNEHEAANAAAAAQAIMDKYSLESAMLEATSSFLHEPLGEFDPLNPGSQRLTSWKSRLTHGLCQVNGCTYYLRDWHLIILIGRPSDAATIRFMFDYLCAEIDRITRERCRGFGKTYGNNFRIGMVDTINERLYEQHSNFAKQARLEAGTAIVLVNNALAKIEERGKLAVAEMERTHPELKKKMHAPTRYDQDAREAGRLAGHEVKLKTGATKGSLTS